MCVCVCVCVCVSVSVSNDSIPCFVPTSGNGDKILIKLSDNNVRNTNHNTKNINSNTGLCSK